MADRSRADNDRSGTRILSNTGSFAASDGTGVGMVTPVSSEESRGRLTEPPTKKSTAGIWLLLLGLVGLGVLPLSLGLGRADVLGADEARALAVSIETWEVRGNGGLSGHKASDGVEGGSGTSGSGLGERLSWVGRLVPETPWYGGKRDLERPPGVTWLHLGAFWVLGLDADRPAVEAMVTGGRLTSVALGLLTVVAVFWVGYSIGGHRTARSGALVLLGCPVFLWYARVGDGTIHHACWPAVAIAAAMWAIRPLRPAPSIVRQFVGWGTAGLAIGAGFLTAGAVAVIGASVPILVALLLSPRRISHVLGLLAALLIAGLVVFPWAVVAHTHDPELWRVWVGQIDVARGLGTESLWVLGRSVIMMLLILLPWTPWLVGAVAQPFSAGASGHRRKTAMCWAWLMTGLVGPVLVGGRGADAAGLYAALPGAAILIGYVFAQFTEYAAQGRRVVVWWVLRWPYLIGLVVASLGVVLVPRAQDLLIAWCRLGGGSVSGPGWGWVVGEVVVLLVVVGFSVRWTVSEFPTRALGCWSLLSVAVFCFAVIPMTDPERTANAARSDARTVRGIAGDRALGWYAPVGMGARSADPALQVYCGRGIRPLDRMGNKERRPRLFYLLTPQVGIGWVRAAVDPAQVELAGHLPRLGLALWRVEKEVVTGLGAGLSSPPSVTTTTELGASSSP